MFSVFVYLENKQTNKKHDNKEVVILKQLRNFTSNDEYDTKKNNYIGWDIYNVKDINGKYNNANSNDNDCNTVAGILILP